MARAARRAFPPHVLDEHAELQLPAALHLERVAAALLLHHSDRHVRLRLGEEARADLRARQVLPVAAGQRGVIHLAGGRVGGPAVRCQRINWRAERQR